MSTTETTTDSTHDDDHHDHPSYLAHHFDDVAQQELSVNMGMWIFLATEVLFFGGALICYWIYRTLHPVSFAIGSSHLNVTVGTINTCVLLVSSLTMALAVHAIQTDDKKWAFRYLLITVALGSVFLGVKAWEYYGKYADHLIPGTHYSTEHALHGTEGLFDHVEEADKEFLSESKEVRNSELFFSLYFGMTGLHALHMIIGIPIILLIAWQTRNGAFSAEYFAPIENIGLYWHFVDIVWVFLFPFLYLIDRFLLV